MCKIYPLPFNKFVVFIFYCLLSITSAQFLDCGAPLAPPKKNFTVVGYVQPNTNPSDIPWKSYDYINIIVPQEGPNLKNPMDFGKFFDSRSNSGASPKIFLSIRPKDPNTLKQLIDEGNLEEEMTSLVDLVNTGFDGVDIEYPGRRGVICKPKGCNGDNCAIWVKERDDQQFVSFLITLKGKLPGKPIMVTVGEHEAILNLHNIIEFLNIETYHHSIYDNVKGPPPNLPFPNQQAGDPVSNLIGFRSTSNGPLDIVKNIYKSYSDIYKDSIKIIMGIDFGNTLQIVTNPNIVQNQTVEFLYNPKDPKEPAIKNLDDGIVKIESLCENPDNPSPSLYSWPRKSLLTSSSDYCNVRPGWVRKFDDKDNALTPWLTKKIDGDDKYYFVSYEDIISISHKLNFLDGVEGVVGISISDISYDNSKNTLLNFIRGKSPSAASPNTPSSPSATGNASNPSHTSDSSNNNSNKGPGSNKVGAIVGSIFGVLAVVALAAASFILWRRKNQLPIFTNKELPGIHTTQKNEMATEPNRFNTPTTVLPVSSTGYVTAMFDFEGKEANDLSFRKGDKIEVLERGDGPNDWWVGRVNGAIGEFPGNYVKETGL